MNLRHFALPVIAASMLPLATSAPSLAAAPVWVSGPNACDVLNDASARQLLGAAAKLTRKAQPNPHMSQCQYMSPNGQITIMVGDWRMVHTANPMDKPLAGLGDEAYTGPSGVYVRKGAVGMNVIVIVQSGEFWGAAADNMQDQMAAAEKKVAVALVPKL